MIRPEEAAPVPADVEELKRQVRAGLSGRDEVAELLKGMKASPPIDTSLFVPPERMRFLIARASMPYCTKDDIEASIREAVEDTVRLVKHHLADRATRPAQPEPSAQEDRIREDERDRLYAEASRLKQEASDLWEDIRPYAHMVRWLQSEDAMPPSERARLRREKP